MKFKNSLDRVKRKMAALELRMEEPQNNQTADTMQSAAMQNLADAAAPPDPTLHERIQRAKELSKQFGMPTQELVNQYSLGKQCVKDDLYEGVHPSYRRHLESNRSGGDRQQHVSMASMQSRGSADPLRTSVSSVLSDDMTEGVSLSYLQHLEQQHVAASQFVPEVEEWRKKLQEKQVSSFHYNAFVRDLEMTADAAKAVAGAAEVSQAAAMAAHRAHIPPQEVEVNLGFGGQEVGAEAIASVEVAGIGAAVAGVGVVAGEVEAVANTIPQVPRLSYAMQLQLHASQKQSHGAHLQQQLGVMHTMGQERIVPDGDVHQLHANLHMTTAGTGIGTGTAWDAHQQQQQERWNHARDSGMEGGMEGSMDGGMERGGAEEWELDGTTPQYRAYL